MSYGTFYLKPIESNETVVISFCDSSTFSNIATVLHLKLAYLNKIGESTEDVDSVSFLYRGDKLNNLFMLHQLPNDVTIHVRNGTVGTQWGILRLPEDAAAMNQVNNSGLVRRTSEPVMD